MLTTEEITALIESAMEDHALLFTTSDAFRHREVDTCKCGTTHPVHFNGRWPTHNQHVAQKSAERIAEQMSAAV